MFLFLILTSPPIKTPTRGSIYGCRVTHSTITSILLPIVSTPAAAAITATASASTQYVGGYSAVAVSARVDMVREQVTDIAKDIRAMDRQLNEFEDSLSEIKDELAFLRRGVIALVHSAELPDIEYK